MFQISHKQFDFWPKNNHVCPKMTNLAKCLHMHDGQEGMSLERRSHDEGGERVKDKKMRTMVNQNLKEFVRNGTLFSARRTWEIRSHMLDVAGNYPGHSKYKASLWLCQACNLEVKEDQEHLTVCEGYQDLRGDADLDNEEELVEFFNSVMERRKLNEWNLAAMTLLYSSTAWWL